MTNGINNKKDFHAENADYELNNSVISFVPTGHWEYNLRTEQLWCSNKAKNIIGLNAQSNDLLLEEIEKYIPKNEKSTQALIELIDRKEFDFEFVTDDTLASKTLRCYAEIRDDNEGNPESIMGVIQNITENKKASNNIILSNRKLRQFSAHCLDVMEDERISLSREIKENIGQKLIASKSELETLINPISDKDFDKNSTSVQQIKSLIDEALIAAKAIVGGLKVDEIQLFGFVYSAKLLINDLRSRYDFTIEFNSNVENINLQPNQIITLYRILQEAISIIILHSSATNINIELEVIDKHLLLEIKNDGNKFQLEKIENNKFKIFGIEQRAVLLQADFEIGYSDDNFTTITLKMPYDAD
jgi:signal transduction histidine kinase